MEIPQLPSMAGIEGAPLPRRMTVTESLPVAGWLFSVQPPAKGASFNPSWLRQPKITKRGFPEYFQSETARILTHPCRTFPIAWLGARIRYGRQLPLRGRPVQMAGASTPGCWRVAPAWTQSGSVLLQPSTSTRPASSCCVSPASCCIRPALNAWSYTP